MAGEFKSDYSSFESRLALFSKPTHYEIANNIKIINQRVVDLGDDIKVVLREMDDNTETLIIFYNGSKRGDPCWFVWMPSENQINAFPKLKEIYDEIEAKRGSKEKYDI